MKIATYETAVEDTRIESTEPVTPGEQEPICIVLPDIEPGRIVQVRRPHFVRREDAADFVVKVIGPVRNS